MSHAFLTAAFYRFVVLDDTEQLRPQLLAQCQAQQVKGNVLLAHEGINGTIAGPEAGVRAVLAWLQAVDDAQLFISAVTLGEIQAGIELTREQDTDKASEIEAWLDQVAAAYNVLPLDAAAYREWARLMHRRSDTLYEDAMIAATARVHGLTVVSRNVADFKALGMEAFNPFTAR